MLIQIRILSSCHSDEAQGDQRPLDQVWKPINKMEMGGERYFPVNVWVKKEYVEAPGKLTMGRKDFVTKMLQDLLKVILIKLHWLIDMLGVRVGALLQRSQEKSQFLGAAACNHRESQVKFFEFALEGSGKEKLVTIK